MSKRLRFCWLVLLACAGHAWALTADEQMRFADGIYLRGFHETAVGEYLVLLRDHPDSAHVPAALYRTGECYRQMGNVSGADRFYRRVETEYPGTDPAARARLRRAEMAIGDGRHADAEGILTGLLKESTTGETAVAALYYLGLSRWKAGDAKGADAAYERLLKENGATPYASFAALDLATMHAGDKDRDDRMKSWFGLAVERAGTSSARAEALFRWGDWAYRKGDYQTAADTLQSLLVEHPQERRAGDALLAAAWSLYYLDRTAEAIEWAERLVASASDEESAASGTFLRANCLRRMNRDGEALADYEAVVRNYTGTSFAERAAYEIMVTHFKRGQYEKALAAAPADMKGSHAADVLWMRAESERELDRLDLARGRYETLLQNHPRSSQAVPALLRLGEMARAAGRLSDAAALFRRVAEEYPQHEAVPEALKASALARLKTGDPEGALADWEALLARKTDVETAAETRLQKALVLVEMGKSREAMKTLDLLIEEGSKSGQTARAQYWRGVLLSEQAKWEEAESALRTSLSGDPDAQTSSLARLRLAVVLQRQNRMDEAADLIETLLSEPERVAENPALVEWLVRRRFEQTRHESSRQAALALAAGAAEASWRQIGWYWAGVNESELGHEAEALRHYQQSVEQAASTREGAEAQLLLAALELKEGRHEQARERYSAAAESATGEEALDIRARAYFGLGETAAAAGEFDQAARHFMSVAILFDDSELSPHSLYRAGEMFGLAGRAEEQARAWSELKARYPDSGFAKQMEKAPQ